MRLRSGVTNPRHASVTGVDRGKKVIAVRIALAVDKPKALSFFLKDLDDVFFIHGTVFDVFPFNEDICTLVRFINQNIDRTCFTLTI